ncbi:dienelactone hydrolase family protein [Sarocladium implicatum]|nr:dienelactone hydrolase family protein [Sarocladium implicatum]
MSGLSECCLKGFQWDGSPSGKESMLADNKAYITGDSTTAALLFIQDAFGWEWRNSRLLADHYAKEAGVTVYLPDFFGGEKLDSELVWHGRFAELDMPGLMSRNGRPQREPEIFKCAKELRGRYDFVAAIGFCYGGWAVFRLGGSESPLIDCGIVGHPSLLTEDDIEAMRAPLQVLAPEHDEPFNEKLRLLTWQTLQKNKVSFDWHFMPGMLHGCLTRGDETVEGEREAVVRGKEAVVLWLKLHLDRHSASK